MHTSDPNSSVQCDIASFIFKHLSLYVCDFGQTLNSYQCYFLRQRKYTYTLEGVSWESDNLSPLDISLSESPFLDFDTQTYRHEFIILLNWFRFGSSVHVKVLPNIR